MLIGVPKEIKVHEYRVGLTPDSAREFVTHGHQVLVQTNAGAGIGCADERYRAAGAEIAGSAKEIFDKAEMIVKVKEPQRAERAMLKEGQVLFTYLHLAPDPDQTRDLVESGVVGVAYETVVDSHGGLPLLAPMSQVAGRLAIQAGAHALEKAHGGKGILLANMPGAVPNTSTYALNNVTLRYGLALADNGYKKALLDNSNFREGLNVCKGMVTHKAVADDLGCDYVDPVAALGG
jgi:alanine dehydrogenase